MEHRVRDADVGAVGLEGDAIISVVHLPMVKFDVGRANSIGAVRVSYSVSVLQLPGSSYCPLTAVDDVAGIVDQDMRKLDMVGVYDRHGP